jgi:4-azaleucine resistance transporter AzlC
MTTRKQEFINGMKAIVPLIAGAVPFGIMFGAIASATMSPAAVMGMSLFVFAGSAQFVAAGLVSQSVGMGIIILTTFVVNLRHALYSASLAPYVKHLSHKWLLPLGFWLTDEAYAVTINRYATHDDSAYKHWFYFGAAVLMYVNWQLCTLIGILAGQVLPNAQSYAAMAMSVTFIGIVVPLIRTRPMLVATVVSGVSAVAFNGLENKLGLMIAAVLGILAGYLVETYAPTAQKTTPISGD